MPTIADLQPIVPKILLWGRPGTGKTPFVASYGAGLQLIDCDRGLLSSRTLQDMWTSNRQKVDVISCLEEDPSKALAFAKLKSTVMDIYNQCVKKTYPFSVLCIDSFTTVADFALRYIQGNSASFGKPITQPQWGLAISELDNIFIWLKAMPIPVCVIFHQREGTDINDHVTEELAIYGKNLPAKIISYFDEVLRIKMRIVNGKAQPYIQTQPEAYTIIRSRGQLKDSQLCDIGFRALLEQLGWKEVAPQAAAK